MKIIFDFDHTLFSAKQFYFAFKEAFFKLGVEENLFKETFEKSKGKGRDYKPYRQFKLVIKLKPKISLKRLKETFDKILKKAPKFLYPDTVWFLKRWRKKAKLILLSYGEEKFQRDKIKTSKIEKYFQKRVKITRDIDKVKPFKKLFQKKDYNPPTASSRLRRAPIIFIEDNPTALSEAKKIFPNMITIRINRGEGKYSKEPNNPQIDFSIKNLKELEKILNSL